MRRLLIPVLSLGTLMGAVSADPGAEPVGILGDTPSEIRFVIPPIIPPAVPKDSSQPPSAPVFLFPPEPERAVSSLSLDYPLGLAPAESLTAEEKVVRDFPAYWARLEKQEGIDILRLRLGMGKNRLNLWTEQNGVVTTNFYAMGKSIWDVLAEEARERRNKERFHAKLDGLMAYAQDLGDRKHSGPAVSIIIAKLDFMKKKSGGKLPSRPDRLRFTENLKAWAVNPVFDSTQLGAQLLRVCSLYEEMAE